MVSRRVAMFVVTSILALGGLASSGAAQGTVKIGVVTELSGPLAAVGASSLDGMRLAVEEINAKGGLLGKKVELVIYDSQGNPSQGVASLRCLVEREKVRLVLGPVFPVV